MTDSNDTKSEQSAPKKLQLTKRVEAGKVQQTFARGRKKAVTVEVKKTRTFSRSEAGKMVEDKQALEDSAANDLDEPRDLTEEEKAARLRALKQAEVEHQQEEIKEVQPDDSITDAADEKEAEAEPVIAPPEEIQKETKDKKAKPAKAEKPTRTFTQEKKKEPEEEIKKVSGKPRNKEEKRFKGKLTISNALEQEERVRSLASIKRARQKAKRQSSFDPTEQEKKVREIIVPEFITVHELASRMAVREQDVIKELMKLDVMVRGNQDIDAETAELIVAEFGHISKLVTEADVEDILVQENIDESALEDRPPVVTIMGHVDHGKTSLLDALRATDIAATEAGGITQHIGAYQIKTEDGHTVTFIDTPGHEAFTAMRARGAKITDIVILVVAADDGIMPQTEEAINHAKAAEVPIIVAINKIDKPDATPQKVKDQLLTHELISEELGGDTMTVEVSAKEKINLDKLIESILLQAEILELKASKTHRARGTVIEAQVDKGKGTVATFLIQQGMLHPGDIVVASTSFGKIRSIYNDKGMTLKEAGPSQPVEVLGLNEPPSAGDEFVVVDQEKQARDITEYRIKHQRDVRAADTTLSAEDLFGAAQTKTKEINVIIKGDVQGSVEAIRSGAEKLTNDEVTVKIVHTGVGAITESDVTLAAAVKAKILGFNVRAEAAIREIAQEEDVDIRYYSVIYDLMDDMKAIVSGMLSPIIREEFLGNAEILQVFKVSKAGKVAGCKVTEGQVKRGAGVRLVRDGIVIHEGKLKTLKRFKDEVNEVKEGMECGMAFENYDDIKEGDTIEAFQVVEEKREL